MSDGNVLKLTSHVGRDLIASAAAFKTGATVVWEYVVNSLQYVDPGVSPRVEVLVKPRKKEIVVIDNGRGMSSDDLSHFFTIHAENIDRIKGRLGRGKFGTGKSAAFGIANSLKIDTIRNGVRNVVVLTRGMIERSTGGDIPIIREVCNEPSKLGNGTIITISDILLDRIHQQPIIEYVERHLQAFRAASPIVAINNHISEYREPEIDGEYKFIPSVIQRKCIGNVELVIKVTRAPLPSDEQGVFITAGAGNLVARETCGIEKKEFGNYLFGEIDVLVLETYRTPIQPYDSSRSLQLNPNHPVAVVLIGFIGSKLEEVRLLLVKKAKEARRSEQARRLALEADKIAEIINEDFNKIRQQLNEIRAASSGKGSIGAQLGREEAGNDYEMWVKGSEEAGDIDEVKGGEEKAGEKGGGGLNLVQRGKPGSDGKQKVDPAGGEGSERKRPKGGFKVEYRKLGKTEDRSRYDPTTLTILINLDHPLVVAAIGEGRIEDQTFRRLSYEIAFTEYAMGIGYESSRQDPNIIADDLLFDVRDTINRISRSAVSLYR